MRGRVSLFKMDGMLVVLSDLIYCRDDFVDNKGLLDFTLQSIEEDKILKY